MKNKKAFFLDCLEVEKGKQKQGDFSDVHFWSFLIENVPFFKDKEKNIVPW